jgi:Ribbon-helix-helix protein, copG family
MATTKVTFTLDPDTLARLRATAARLAVPRSAVVREAIRDFSERAGSLGEGERRRLLGAFDRLVPAIPRRPLADVTRELAALRRARRAGGRLHGATGRGVR